MKHLLLGDEAIAQGAIDAGLSGVYAYPGTPSTEITEYIQLQEKRAAKGIFCQWATNEKTAMEGALGMSYMGKRALVCMKHVGMNVCADAFMNAAITGVNGGLVVVAADDPSMHSSQNEQDSRFYAKFAMVPCLEPSNQQEAYDMMHYAFDLSESLRTPILLRVTTRMAHSRAVVEIMDTPREQNVLSAPENTNHFILLPAFARRNYAELVEAQTDFIQTSEESQYNSYTKGSNPKKAIVTTGIAYNYLMEAMRQLGEKEQGDTILKIAQYPLP
jgi:indolepyruvate ferredoxin oxidoreductase alpha subunit